MIYAVILACGYAIFMSFWVVHLHNESEVYRSRLQHRDLVIEELRSEIDAWRKDVARLKSARHE